MTRILVSPVHSHISNREYGKSYNILNNLQDSTFEIEAYVGEAVTPIEADNVIIHELHTRNKLKYYGRCFETVAKEFCAGNVDIYHHMNLSYRWFNPVLLAGIGSDTPTVLGPCQAGHAIMSEEFNTLLAGVLNRELPMPVSNALYYPLDAIRDMTIDPIRMELFKKTLAAADRIIVVHEDAKDLYTRFVDEAKIEVIPLGVDPELFEFQGRSETQELVAIGRLDRRKAYDILLEALAQIAMPFPDVHLNIFGQGPEEEALREQAEKLGISDNLTFHGYVDQSVLRDYLAEARAFVHPSRSESFSLVRLEAMAVGCPVVISDIDGAHEMVRSGKEGFVVPTESAEAIADAVTTLLADFDLASEIGQQARARVEEKYDWRTIGQHYLNVYKDLLSD
ncbi:Glycosyltransferase involved in cell wall bisynthesis [Halorubrum xinjiangense]|uniref:Glycosyltransferase involved in cell wall bisynthesis n=1 Tax=Halorubrum xinjiangense TaxID=261291 RepID=A0A1G7NK05_9EURY|nr:glycosyltransferase family 4 protein [Halorubrum xinjiangense]SDF74404.1 Glycosyltransferase involved in cell wall bisynthesis [Halorubrum xinjiangense]